MSSTNEGLTDATSATSRIRGFTRRDKLPRLTPCQFTHATHFYAQGATSRRIGQTLRAAVPGKM